MKYHAIFCYLLLMLLSWQQTCTANPILVAQKVITIGLKVYQLLQSAEHMLEDKAVDFLDSGDRLQHELKGLSKDVQDLKDTLLRKLRTDFRDKLTERTDAMFKQIDSIDDAYEVFMETYRQRHLHDPDQVRNAANEVVSILNSVIKRQEAKMYRALVLKDISDDNVLTILLRNNSEPNVMCKRGTSAQLMIHSLYELVMTTETKGLLMNLYSWDIKKTFENKSEEHVEFEKSSSIKRYNKTVETLFEIVFDAMSHASRQILKCDPHGYEKDVTYFKFSGVLQTYVMYQTDTVDHKWSAFWTKCKDYTNEKLDCHSYPCQTQPAERRCYGQIRDCQFISRSIQLCHSPLGSDRRYDWMVANYGTDNEVVYGHKKSDCGWFTQGVGSALSIDTCVCTCSSKDKLSDRYISMREELSDVAQNKVVTGVRFTKKNRVLHLQIQQATVGPEGNITDIPSWKDVEEVTDAELLDNDRGVVKKKVFKIGYKKNTILLDDVLVDPGYVVTGLRFTRHKNNLCLEVHQTTFDYTSGKLNAKPDWMSWVRNHCIVPMSEREKVNLVAPDDPATVVDSDIYSHGSKYVSFIISDLMSDLGQNVVPYIDLQNITTNPPLPLDGLGIYHRGKKNFGGFVAPKIIHYDFTKHDDDLDIKGKTDLDELNIEDILYW